MTALVAPTGTGTDRSSLSRLLPFVLIAVAVVLLGLASRNGRTDGEPLDPRSTGPLGAKGLVLLLERFGADVRIGGGLPADGAVAVLLQDALNENETDRLEAWVEDGGTLVVADPLSSFSPTRARIPSGIFDPEGAGDDPQDGLEPECDLPALAAVRRIEVATAAGLRVARDAVGCFPTAGGAFLVARPSGEGTVVALGGGGPLVNEQLDRADNAVLAVSLMAPRPEGRVVIVEPSALGGGQQGLTELVSSRVKDGLWQLLVAFVLFALWRARRLGRPVDESQPVQIAGSELVVAVGNLLQQGRRRDAAARMMQASLRRTLSERLGVPPDASATDFASAAAARTGLDAADVAAALDEHPPQDDAALVALACSVESLRNEVTHAR